MGVCDSLLPGVQRRAVVGAHCWEDMMLQLCALFAGRSLRRRCLQCCDLCATACRYGCYFLLQRLVTQRGGQGAPQSRAQEQAADRCALV